jgi:DnaJ domain
MLWGMLAPTVSRADTAEPYRVLGIEPTASADDVRRAFRTLVRRYHPDTNPAVQPGGELNAVVTAYRRLGSLGVLARPEPEPDKAPAATRVTGRYVDVYA